MLYLPDGRTFSRIPNTDTTISPPITMKVRKVRKPTPTTLSETRIAVLVSPLEHRCHSETDASTNQGQPWPKVLPGPGAALNSDRPVIVHSLEGELGEIANFAPEQRLNWEGEAELLATDDA